ncbi:MAG: glycogen/starch/alpha-glucan phosphorylase [Deltaproteobacteria bacterium]|nr:MAG: glycogen/starch/alpha-glucan phosphorylase [Deltaproteobacteria bacterium]
MRRAELFKHWGTFDKGLDSKSIQRSFAAHLEYSLARDQYTAKSLDLYHSLALSVRDRLVERWIRTQQMYYDRDVKMVYYLSSEYLMGKFLINSLINLDMYEETRKAMQELNIDLNELAELEADAGLGHGGLGRLAACFMDSLAAMEIPAYGYGIRYEFGIFDQIIRNLGQVELPETWLKHGNPWEIPRTDRRYTVRFYGRVRETHTDDGWRRYEWLDAQEIIGIAYDIPIDGYDNNTVNTLRLWSARAPKEFDLQYFQHGDYYRAVEDKYISENISKVLYPSEDIYQGRELRLKQQYFFVSCSIQDIVRRYLTNHESLEAFPEKVAIHINETNPSLAIPELMRILVDEHGLDWETAWEITTRSCSYTNHTLLTEGLEQWPVSMFEQLLPYHLQIIYEINQRFLDGVSAQYPGDVERLRRMSLIGEEGEKRIRMAQLAIVGSHSVNGVSEIHTRLFREKIFNDFNDMFPERFNNKTNGISPRRWMFVANPGLAGLITKRIGRDWVKDLSRLGEIEPLANDAEFQEQFNAVKQENKERLVKVVGELTGFTIDPRSIFDAQVKRIHEYKRQLLNILHVIHCWQRSKEDPDFDLYPRTFLFGGKAAPGYFMAKMIIRLICHVAEKINRDSTNELIKVVFLPNYRVSLAENIIPAVEVSEQISTAGFEASGTGNMKFVLNGALIVGTFDGANIEIKEEVGEENIFIFGLTAEEVRNLRASYNPGMYCEKDPALKRAIEIIRDGFFSPGEPDLFKPLVEMLLNQDPYLVLADFEDYCRCQRDVDKDYRNRELWTRKAILNVARVGKFSSDRTILEYNRDIWHAEPISVTREDKSSQTPEKT